MTPPVAALGNASYLYEVVTRAQDQSASAFLVDANARGARGFRLKYSESFGNGVVGTIFERDISSNAKYVYEVVPRLLSQSTSAFVAEGNAQGARGFKVLYLESFGSGVIANIYERDISSNAKYAYEVVPRLLSQSTSAFVAEGNAQGARGFKVLYLESFGSGVIANIYERVLRATAGD